MWGGVTGDPRLPRTPHPPEGTEPQGWGRASPPSPPATRKGRRARQTSFQLERLRWEEAGRHPPALPLGLREQGAAWEGKRRPSRELSRETPPRPREAERSPGSRQRTQTRRGKRGPDPRVAPGSPRRETTTARQDSRAPSPAWRGAGGPDAAPPPWYLRRRLSREALRWSRLRRSRLRLRRLRSRLRERLWLRLRCRFSLSRSAGTGP